MRQQSGCAGAWLDPSGGGVDGAAGYSVPRSHLVDRVAATATAFGECRDLGGEVVVTCHGLVDGRAADDDGDLATDAGPGPGRQLAQRSSTYLLVGLRQLAADGRRPVG